MTERRERRSEGGWEHRGAEGESGERKDSDGKDIDGKDTDAGDEVCGIGEGRDEGCRHENEGSEDSGKREDRGTCHRGKHKGHLGRDLPKDRSLRGEGRTDPNDRRQDRLPKDRSLYREGRTDPDPKDRQDRPLKDRSPGTVYT